MIIYYSRCPYNYRDEKLDLVIIIKDGLREEMQRNVHMLSFFQAVEHDSTLENTPSVSQQSLTEEEKVNTLKLWVIEDRYKPLQPSINTEL